MYGVVVVVGEGGGCWRSLPSRFNFRQIDTRFGGDGGEKKKITKEREGLVGDVPKF